MTNRKAEEELELHFAGASWGLHAGPLDGSGGVSVWDERRSNVEHGRRHAPARIAGHDRLRRIADTVARLKAQSPQAWADAMVVLTPRRWPTLLAAEMDRGAKRGNLAGLLLTSERLARVTGRTTPGELLEAATRRAESSEAGQKFAFFQPLRIECEKRFEAAVAAYAALRRKGERSEVKEMREVFA